MIAGFERSPRGRNVNPLQYSCQGWQAIVHGVKSVNLKGNQPGIFTGRADAKGEAPILWPPDAKSQLIGKDPDAGKDWGPTEDEMVR